MGTTAFPGYHPRPSSGWLNDPNGPIQVDGSYHLFFQYSPDSSTWGRIRWGHMRTRDLVTWEEYPIALVPSDDGPDRAGCWSGCAVRTDQGVTLVYTGVHRVGDDWQQSVCLAHGSESLDTWQKDAANPVVAGPPPDLDVVGFRDPFVWRRGQEWAMAVGSGIRGAGGRVLLYRSADLRTWTYLGPLAEGNAADEASIWTGTMWECPQLLFFEDRTVLLISVHDDGRLLYALGSVGRMDGNAFHANGFERVDFGHDFYAPAVTRDESGRYVLWGWLWEGRSPASEVPLGWAGVLSLPRVVSLGTDGRLWFTPAPELKALRRRHVPIGRTVVPREPATISPTEASIRLPELAGDLFELDAVLEGGAAHSVGLRIRATPDLQEYVSITWDRYRGELIVSRDAASADSHASKGTSAVPVRSDDGRLRFRLFLDRSVLEIYTADGRTLTERIYPLREDSLEVFVFAYGGEAAVAHGDWWELPEQALVGVPERSSAWVDGHSS